MSKWYRRVTTNMSDIVEAISHFEKEIEEARFECGMKGILEKQSRDMPGIVEHRFNQLQEFVDGEEDVISLQYLINDFSLVRNRFIGIIKALEAKQFQINNIVKLRAAGLEDISL